MVGLIDPWSGLLVTAAGGGGGGLGLQTSCTAFWELENTSWTDALGVNDLTGNGSPTTTTGAVGSAADLTASTTWLSHADASALSLGNGSFSIQMWFNGNPPASGAISKTDGGFANKEYWVGSKFTSANKWAWAFLTTTSAGKECVSSVTCAAGWHHIVCTWDGTTQKIYVDNGTADTNTPGASGIDSTSTFMIGKDGDSGGTAPAKYDQVGLWKGRVLTSTDVGLLYNSGSGLTWAAMA